MQAFSNTSSACLAGRVLAYGCTQSSGHCMRGQYCRWPTGRCNII
jgi:hypothetical protein